MNFRPGIVLPWFAFATLNCQNKIWGEGLIPHLPTFSQKMDKNMGQDWQCYWPWRWKHSDMQILYWYIRCEYDEVKSAKKLGTTKYVIRDRIKRLNLTKERIKEVLKEECHRNYKL